MAGKQQVVGYSGPTLIAISSGKQSTSIRSKSRDVDVEDFKTLINLQDYSRKDRIRQCKTHGCLSVDGGPNKNPRSKNVMGFAIQHFRKYNLGELFIATKAPGSRAFNSGGTRNGSSHLIS